ncbi:mothers against decapentaplegic homolog 6-like isoform X1 [Nerophis lumbriciformis]|uniref:mothers against decapentaplegic homolog 6-like isoform X1 n=1 Tax=Nerophis lumbriciformis TaxID=546530 RepID=UPI002AE09CD1|nr:mothers against decapentaplegic homolog 6-like isoform X1 [Nerophis lumbriciformis]
MFRSRRSGLVRRLWRSRAVAQRDGSGGCPCGSRQQGPVTRVGGPAGEAGEEAGRADNDPGTMCGDDAETRTVTCCLFADLRGPRTPRKDNCECGLLNITHAFLKKLPERSLDVLLKAVETKGGVASDCVMVPAGTELRVGAHRVSSQHLLCRMYRWGDLPPSAHLKALCHCQSFGGQDGAKVCCNPYHYSRLCGPESPPPPYSVSHSDEHKPLADKCVTASFLDIPDSPLSYTEPARPLIMPTAHTETGTSLGSSSSCGRRSHWCSVAYWEQRTRVGRLYPAHEPSLSVFYDLPQGTGLCLSQLRADVNHCRRDDHDTPVLPSYPGQGGNGGGGIRATRSKIGYGIVLSREPDGVWVYNRSQHPVFVHSPTLDLLSAGGLSVKRVMPGFSLKVFDYESSSWMAQHGIEPESQEGPWDPHSVRISFAKGWGPCYSRQFITSCPCWLEVLLNTHR